MIRKLCVNFAYKAVKRGVLVGKEQMRAAGTV